MKLIHTLIFSLIFLCIGTTANAANEAGVMFVTTPGGTGYAGTVEFAGQGNTSVVARIGHISYSITDGDYWEDGVATIIGASWRFYTEQATEGMFFGLGADYVTGTFDNGVWGAWYGYGSLSGIAPVATIGFKKRNDNLSFEPSVYASMVGGDRVQAAVGIGLAVSGRF